MTIVLLIMVLVLVGTNVFTGIALQRKRNQLSGSSITPALTGNKVPAAITSEKHQLERTFFDRRISTVTNTGQDYHGWHFVCSCGTVAPAVDNDTNYNYIEKGSEQGAVKAFVNHRTLYASTVEAGENIIEDLKRQLKEQQDNCICKDLH